MASEDNRTTGLNSINLDQDGLKINGKAVTTSAAEPNKLDGVGALVASS